MILKKLLRRLLEIYSQYVDPVRVGLIAMSNRCIAIKEDRQGALQRQWDCQELVYQQYHSTIVMQ